MVSGIRLGITFVLGTLLIQSWMGSGNAWAGKSWILCSRDSEVTAVAPQFGGQDPCTGAVKIQGISYLCGKPEDTAKKTREFLEQLKVNGKKKCEDYCAGRASGCQGYFTAPQKCGLSIPQNRVLEVGRETAGCNPSCQGEGFIYCSIYHGGYLSSEDWMFKGKDPNCRCGWVK